MVIRILSIMSLKEIKYRNFKAKIVKLSNKQAKKEMIYGYYNPNESTIAIQENLGKISYVDTLLHEIAHFIADKSAIRLKNLGEEGVATFIGSEFCKVFLQNPKLLTFIKKNLSK